MQRLGALCFVNVKDYDTVQFSDSFFYNWSELAIVPVEWCRFGMVSQHTRVYKTERDIQRVLFVGIGDGHLEATTYVFNPDDGEPTAVMASASVSDERAWVLLEHGGDAGVDDGFEPGTIRLDGRVHPDAKERRTIGWVA